MAASQGSCEGKPVADAGWAFEGKSKFKGKFKSRGEFKGKGQFKGRSREVPGASKSASRVWTVRAATN